MDKKIVIIGGVAGGASAAARARRLSERSEIIIFEKGEHISFANCGLPYYIGGEIKDRDRLLLLTPDQIYKTRKIQARTNTVITSINREDKTVSAYNYVDKTTYKESYTDLILSPGASLFIPDIAGVNSDKIFTLRNIADMDKINQAIENSNDNNVAVIGGGFIGLEIAEALVNRGKKVSLIELGNQLMPSIDQEMSSLINQELQLQGVDIHLNCSVNKFTDKGNSLELTLSNAKTLNCGFSLIAIGVKPDASLAKQAGLDIGDQGGILVNEHMRTNDTSIYAVGDAIETKDFISKESKLVPLAGPANRQGRIAADNIFGHLSSYRNTQSTAICKVFNMTVGSTGLNEKSLQQSNIPYEKIYLHPFNHASYYTGASPISIKLLFDSENGAILGAQAVGQDGIDKRIDVFSVAIRAKLSVFDLEHLELSYAPPYGSAKDAVNYAGFIASNVMRGDIEICHANELTGNETLLDVRLATEVAAGSITDGIHIPLEELRDNLHKLPNDETLIVYCKEGLRAYQACLTLNQLGFKAINLSGGYKTYRMFHEEENIYETKLSSDQLSQSANDTHYSPEVVKEIDATGLSCPGPILKLKQSINRIKGGEALRIISTDPGFVQDVPKWCTTTGHMLAEVKAANGSYYAIVIKKSARTAN